MFLIVNIQLQKLSAGIQKSLSISTNEKIKAAFPLNRRKHDLKQNDDDIVIVR